jgi:hypothetical protein
MKFQDLPIWSLTTIAVKAMRYRFACACIGRNPPASAALVEGGVRPLTKAAGSSARGAP